MDQSRGTFMARAAVESASDDADGWQGLINVGYAFETSYGTISPYVGLEWQQLSVDSFDTTDGPLPISVSGDDIDSFRTSREEVFSSDCGSRTRRLMIADCTAIGT